MSASSSNPLASASWMRSLVSSTTTRSSVGSNGRAGSDEDVPANQGTRQSEQAPASSMKWYSPSRTPDTSPALAASGLPMNSRAFSMLATSNMKNMSLASSTSRQI